jgi:hypothetical protein
MRTRITTPPAILPVAWEDVKQHLRLEDMLADEEPAVEQFVMDTYVAGATRTATGITRHALITTQYETVAVPEELTQHHGYAALVLPWPDLQSIESVTYDGAALVEGTDYQLLTYADGTTPAQPGTLLFPRALFGWAMCRCGWGCDGSYDTTEHVVRVEYTAGYGDLPADVPGDIRSWILMRVGALYTNREEVTNKLGGVDSLPFTDSLLTQERDFEFS